MIISQDKKKKIKWKKFSKMKPHEKQTRIKFLWAKARSYVMTLKFIKTTQNDLDNDFLKEFAQNVEFDDETLDKSYHIEETEKLPKYLIYES